MVRGHDGLVVNNKNQKNQNRSDILGIFFFSVYACHSQVNLPKGKAVSVCESSLNPNTLLEEIFLTFPFVLREELGDFP